MDFIDTSGPEPKYDIEILFEMLQKLDIKFLATRRTLLPGLIERGANSELYKGLIAWLEFELMDVRSDRQIKAKIDILFRSTGNIRTTAGIPYSSRPKYLRYILMCELLQKLMALKKIPIERKLSRILVIPLNQSTLPKIQPPKVPLIEPTKSNLCGAENNTTNKTIQASAIATFMCEAYISHLQSKSSKISASESCDSSDKKLSSSSDISSFALYDTFDKTSGGSQSNSSMGSTILDDRSELKKYDKGSNTNKELFSSGESISYDEDLIPDEEESESSDDDPLSSSDVSISSAEGGSSPSDSGVSEMYFADESLSDPMSDE